MITKLKGLLLGALVVVLSGCSSWGLTPEEAAKLTPQQKFFKLQGEVIAGFEPAVVYAQKPPCTIIRKVDCHNPEIVAKLAQLKVEVDYALDEAKVVIFGDSTGDETNDAILVATSLVARILARLQYELVRAGFYDSAFDQGVVTYGQA